MEKKEYPARIWVVVNERGEIVSGHESEEQAHWGLEYLARFAPGAKALSVYSYEADLVTGEREQRLAAEGNLTLEIKKLQELLENERETRLAAQRELTLSEDALEQRKETVEELCNRVAELEDELAEAKEKSTKDLQWSESRRANLERKLADVVEVSRRSSDRSRGKIEELEGQIRELERQIIAEKDEARQCIANLEEHHIAATMSQWNKHQAEKAELEQTIAELKKKLEEARAVRLDDFKLIAKLEREKLDLAAENASLRIQAANLKSELAHLRDKLREVRAGGARA